MKIAHRKAQAEAYKSLPGELFSGGLNDECVSSLAPSPSRVSGEVVDLPENEAQAINIADEVSPPTYGTLDADSVCVNSDETPGELPAWCEKALFFGDFSPVGAGLLFHGPLLPRERSKLKGDFCPQNETLSKS